MSTQIISKQTNNIISCLCYWIKNASLPAGEVTKDSAKWTDYHKQLAGSVACLTAFSAYLE